VRRAALEVGQGYADWRRSWQTSDKPDRTLEMEKADQEGRPSEA
jgi:hypothetical protein